MFTEHLKYLKDNPHHYWFKRKLYGWGWTPATREGWLATGAYLVVVIALSLTIDDNSSDREIIFMFLVPIIFLTGAFIGICYAKGEKPQWQWGLKDDKDIDKE